MIDQRCLYTLIYAPRESHETILRDFVTPVVREIRGEPDLDSLFFARYNEPRWQLRFRVLGRPAWVDGPVRDLVKRSLEPIRALGEVGGIEFAMYQREFERYGGEEGMALAEKIFHEDTIACLDLIEAERDGGFGKTRREWSLLLTERLLDLMRFDRASRLAFYAYGYRWALEQKTWEEEELRILGEKYRALKPGLSDLVMGDPSRDPAEIWGGETPARIAERWTERTRPVVQDLLAAHAAGRIHRDLVNLAWSYTHMSCNRLGIDPTAEAILRFFLHRLLEESPAGA